MWKLNHNKKEEGKKFSRLDKGEQQKGEQEQERQWNKSNMIFLCTHMKIPK